MNILILGAGGREHAFAWKLKQSKHLTKLFIAPGNAGTSTLGVNVPIAVNDFQSIKELVLKEQIQLVLVGPEDPLVNGIHDYFRDDKDLASVAVIGPEKLAATLEGSKEFAKEFMIRHQIPTARYKSFTADTVEEGFAFLEQLAPPYVLKADGLAAGKGVVILNELDAAKKELRAMLVDAKFGVASTTVVIEEFLEGIELSVFVLTDGDNYKILPTAKDYKRIGEGDTGLNTGGMGAISPVPFATDSFMHKIEQQIVKRTVEGLKIDNIRYVGFIFIGLMKVGEEPKVIEYNVRMGDPETEVVLPRIKNDFVLLLRAAAEKRLKDIDIQIDERAATTVMMVSGGYPMEYEKGLTIRGVDGIDDALVFHAGTTKEDGNLVTNGGRVMAVTALGKDVKTALATTYKNVAKISFEGMNYRKDLGFDL